MELCYYFTMGVYIHSEIGVMWPPTERYRKRGPHFVDAPWISVASLKQFWPMSIQDYLSRHGLRNKTCHPSLNVL